MHTIKEAIVVEGKYDKAKLAGLFDTLIISTDGFSVFTSRSKQELIRSAAARRGIIVLTDSDRAGFIIRRFISGMTDKSYVKHAYIPQLAGKEKRKESYSKDGFLGVEGLSDDIIIGAVNGAATMQPQSKDPITKADLYGLGLCGRSDSAAMRAQLAKKLKLPTGLSSAALLQVLNCMYTRDEFLQTEE